MQVASSAMAPPEKPEKPAWAGPWPEEPFKRNSPDSLERNDPADMMLQNEYFKREYAIAVEEIKIMQACTAWPSRTFPAPCPRVSLG